MCKKCNKCRKCKIFSRFGEIRLSKSGTAILSLKGSKFKLALEKSDSEDDHMIVGDEKKREDHKKITKEPEGISTFS